MKLLTTNISNALAAALLQIQVADRALGLRPAVTIDDPETLVLDGDVMVSVTETEVATLEGRQWAPAYYVALMTHHPGTRLDPPDWREREIATERRAQDAARVALTALAEERVWRALEAEAAEQERLIDLTVDEYVRGLPREEVEALADALVTRRRHWIN